jgi:peptidyl-prolyl cis-trans isomerase D
MLRGIRKASSNWLGKSVMALVVGLLVVSFAIWGIGDMFQGFGRSAFATVGGTEVSIEQFRQLYNDRLQRLGRQFGRPISLDQARALGLDRQIVRQIISEMVLDEKVRALKLSVSDAEVSRRITSDQNFLGTDGKFDHDRFLGLIRQAGYTEQRFILETRKEMLQRQLEGTVTGPSLLPKAMVEAADRFQNEQRSIEYALLDQEQAGEIPEPEADVLAKFYDERKALFRAPEYRKVVVVSLIPADQAQWIEISDADIRQAYEDRKARYTTPERRHVQQMVFPNADQARAAAERIAKGETFDAIAKERGLSDTDIDLGTLTKAAMIDKAIAEAAFALKEGEISAPVQGRFGTVLVRVVAIEPEQVTPFESVAGQIKTDLATERAKADILNVYDKMEDERSIGTPLAEAAEKLKLAVRTIEIDSGGRDPSNEAVTKVPDAQRVFTGAFSTEVGAENAPLQFEGGYVWYEVSGITPARERSLDEVKDEVVKRWHDDQVAAKLRAKANELLDQIKSGKPFADVLVGASLTVETKAELKRGAAAAPLSARGVEAVFRTAKDATGAAEAEQPSEQVIFRVTDIVVPTLDLASAETKRIQETLNQSMNDDVLGQYITQLESDIGVKINQAALRQVVTGQSGTDN